MLTTDAGITDEVMTWFEGKGILPETLFHFGITVGEAGEVNFPYGVNTKKRYGVPDGKRGFSWPKGQRVQLYNEADAGRKTIFLVEGETDTIRLKQEVMNNPDVGVLGLPGVESWSPDFMYHFTNTENVYVILDNDEDYAVQGRVDACMHSIRETLGKRARRIKLPSSVNDICDFFQQYDLDALRLIVDRVPKPGDSAFRSLDLTLPPPPVKWMVEDMICQGDINLLIGEPGIGKSWFTMDLAIAIAGGKDTFLSHRINKHGRVLYIDEENPEDLVYQRMTKLGMTKDVAKNIRYISNAGIRLDRDPDTLLEEAFSFDPILIVLDSLTRLHTEDENNAGAISKLFNDAIKPLSREAGAAVLLIHHVNKTDSPSGYKRSRGSGDITGSPDAAFDVRDLGNGILQVVNYKSRRIAQGHSLYYTIQDTPEGGVKLEGGPDIPIAF
jgi:hypothetical protein